jgi:zinc protease
MRAGFGVCLSVTLALGGCAPKPALVSVPPLTTAFPTGPMEALEPERVTPDAPFRAAAPAATSSIVFRPPQIREAQLKNGIPLALSERPGLEIVSVRISVREPELEKPGVLAFFAAMLEQGTPKRDAAAISDAFEAIGCAHSFGFNSDGGSYTIRTPKRHLEAALGLVREMLQDADFPQVEFERLQTRRKIALAQEGSSLQAMGQNALISTIFGRAHPYGNSAFGREADIAGIKREDLLRVKAKFLQASRMHVAVSGATTLAEIMPLLDRTLAFVSKAKPAAATKEPAPVLANERLIFVHKAKSAQSYIAVAAPGTTRNDEDRFSMAVLNTVFGGAFSSRVNLNLREAHAYTYGARSRFVSRRFPGHFVVGASVRTNATGPAISEVLNEIRAAREKPLSEAELRFGKDSLLQSYGARFETNGDVTEELSDLFMVSAPKDEIARYNERIEAVTAEQALATAKRFFADAGLRIIVVGDRESVLPQLASLGLGEPSERDAFGDVPAAALGAGLSGASETGTSATVSAPGSGPAKTPALPVPIKPATTPAPKSPAASMPKSPAPTTVPAPKK